MVMRRLLMALVAVSGTTLAAAAELRVFSEPDIQVCCAVFSPDGAKILLGLTNNTATLWEAATGEKLRTFAGHKDNVCSVAFFPDGKRVLTGSNDGSAKIWDMATGAELRTLVRENSLLSLVVIAPDGNTILGGAGGFGLWTTKDPTLYYNGAALLDVATDTVLHAYPGRHGFVLGVAFSPDGKKNLVGFAGGKALLYDVATGEESRNLSVDGCKVNAVAFSPDGSKLLLGLGGDNRADVSCHKAVLWDVATGTELGAFDRHAPASVFAVAFSPDGTKMAAGYNDNTVQVWDVMARTVLQTFAGHGGRVKSVAFSPDGTKVLTGAEDGTARLWEVAP